MYLLLIFLSLLGSSLAGLFGKHIGSKGSIFVTTNCLFLSFIISVIVFYEVSLMNSFVFISITPWIECETFNINWGFMFDSLTTVMCVIITFVSFLVHLYSAEYMSHDPHLPRFMSYLSLFTFFMLILVTADNLLQMFIGWEGVGLCSYLLINFWYTRIQANKAAIKAMILNRIGDFSLLIGIMLFFTYFSAVDYATLILLTPFFKNKVINFCAFNCDLLTLIGIFLFLGAIGKSAQLGLHTWLPDAMEGPTPVSALIHAATMVTAGVFLLARSSFLYEQIENVLKIIIIIGAVTSLLAATIGLVQNDLKRVIAYSTCSQLGYMIFVCGLSQYSVGIFHLSNHAFFKALLFLSAGSIIHAVQDEQDMRKMGGLKNLLPFTYSMMLIGSLALIGFPFLSGFYSKDLVLEIALSNYNVFGQFAYLLGTVGAFLTAFYSTRLLYLTFLIKPLGYKKILWNAVDSGNNITFVLGCLAVPSIFIGYFTKEMFVGIGNCLFNNVIFFKYNHTCLFDAEFMSYNQNMFFLDNVSLLLKLLPVLLSLLGVMSAIVLYKFSFKNLINLKISKSGRKIYQFLNKKWFFDKIYNELLGQTFFKFGYSLSYKFIDKGIFEMLGPTGISLIIYKLACNVHKLQTNSIYHCTLSILISSTFLIGFRQVLLYTYTFNILNFAIIILLIFFLMEFNNNKIYF